MTPSEVRAIFVQADIDQRAVEIRHHNQTEFMRFETYSYGEKGASGIMPANSGLWPRSARFSEIAEARLA